MIDRDDPVPEEPRRAEAPAQPQPSRMSHQEMLDVLGVMARQLVDEAPDTLKETTAVAAEWTAQAARSSAPYAHRLAEVAEEASLSLAERSERLAADLRAELAAPSAPLSPDLADHPDAEREEADEGDDEQIHEVVAKFVDADDDGEDQSQRHKLAGDDESDRQVAAD